MCKMKNRLTELFIGLLALLFLVTGCLLPEEGLSPVGAVPSIPRKELVTTFGTANPHYVRTVLHVDTEKQNPLNAMDFYFGWTVDGIPFDDHPFFEHVVLGYAYLSKDLQGNINLNKTETLQYILDSNKTFLAPLILKGIKILVEVRSGCFAPDEEGIGVGFGTFDMASVNLFAPQLQDLIDRYGINGFEFNDEGGGYKAYPPYTRELKKFGDSEPLYPDSLFQDDDGNWLSGTEIEAILWREGGANFADFIVYVNEHLKERRRVPANFGSINEDGRTIEVIRSLITRGDNGHGRYMHTETRPAYTPDAYTGATTYVLWNMIAFVNGIVNKMETGSPFLFMWDAALKRMVKQDGAFFSPFIIDLSAGNQRLSTQEARALGFGFAGTAVSPNRFGTLYFSNLPAAAEDPGIAAYLSNFTTQIFGRPVFMYEGGGNRPDPAEGFGY